MVGLLLFAPSDRKQNVYLKDDFESETLSPIWSTFRLPDGALNHVTSPTRSGHGAVEISVHSRDRTEIGRNGELTERAELSEAPDARLLMGTDVWYAFSFFLPADFPIVDTRLVIAQWKQACLDCTKKRSPMVSLRYYAGKLRVYIENTRGRQKLYSQRLDLRNMWVDMVFHIIAKPDDKGVVQMWRNGVQIVNHTGALGFKDDSNEVYFKMGLYRDHLNVPMHIFIDCFRRGSNMQAVSCN